MRISVFARAPIPGKCKSRLAQTLGPERAAEFAARSLDALIERLHGLGAQWSIMPADVTDAVWFERSGYADCLGETQVAGDLGRRMSVAHREAFAEGARISAIVGSDCPDAPLEQLLEHLRDGLYTDPDVPQSWLCPAQDGGYWCWAVNRACAPVLGEEWAGVEWSSGRERAQTAQRLGASGVAVEEILPAYDVDTYADFVALVQRLEHSTSELAARRDVPAWQRRLLLTLHDLLGN